MADSSATSTPMEPLYSLSAYSSISDEESTMAHLYSMRHEILELFSSSQL